MRRSGVLVMFLLSGAAGLVYQVAWARKLNLILGVTSEAVSTVLAVFMGGLALGSWLLGRQADRARSPLRLYGALELGVAVAGAASPFLLDALFALYVGARRGGLADPAVLTILRITLAAAALLVPTTLMGGTLPILVRGLNRSPGWLSRDAGTLYAINTLGAVIGTLVSAFVLIQAVGIRSTIWLAAALNAVVGLVALALARGEEDAGQPPPAHADEVGAPAPPADLGTGRAVLVAFTVSGFVALAYEVLWTRSLIVVVGENSVYAFSLILAAFLVGIVAGSTIAARIGDRTPNLVRLLGIVMVGVGASALFTSSLMISVAGAFPIPADAGFLESSLRRFLRSLGVLIVPTTFSGMTFAIVAKIYARDPARVGRDAGVAYAANTLGAIAGALAGGFLILPQLGLERGLLVLSGVSVVTGFALVLRRGPDGRRGFDIAAAALLFVLAGAYSVGSQRDPFRAAMDEAPDSEVLFYEPGKESTVAVVRSPSSGELGLVVDGDSQAGTHAFLQISLRLLGHLPVLFHADPKDVLVIALGAGITTGSALQHPIARLDQVELSRSVIRAAPLFAPFNHDPLHDPRLHLIIDDGRNFLLSTDRSYDVITSDPIDPDDAGVTSLYSKEYYELIRDHLRPGGVAAQWIPSRYDAESYWLLVRTFQAVFPATSIWHSGITTVVVGYKDAPSVDFQTLTRRVANPRVRASLGVVGIQDASALLSLYTAGPDETRRLAGDGPLNTDDRPRIEYSGPRWMGANLQPISPEVGVDLVRLRRPDLTGWVADWSAADTRQIAPDFELMTRVLERNAVYGPIFFEAETARPGAGPSPQALDEAARAWLDRSWEALVAEAPRIVRMQVGLKEIEPPAGTPREAAARYQEAMAAGRAAWQAGAFEEARVAFASAGAAVPALVRPQLLAAATHERSGDLPAAIHALLSIRPTDREVGGGDSPAGRRVHGPGPRRGDPRRRTGSGSRRAARLLPGANAPRSHGAPGERRAHGLGRLVGGVARDAARHGRPLHLVATPPCSWRARRAGPGRSP